VSEYSTRMLITWIGWAEERSFSTDLPSLITCEQHQRATQYKVHAQCTRTWQPPTSVNLNKCTTGTHRCFTHHHRRVCISLARKTTLLLPRRNAPHERPRHETASISHRSGHSYSRRYGVAMCRESFPASRLVEKQLLRYVLHSMSFCSHLLISNVTWASMSHHVP
jgi:hypothetical protein